MAGDSDRRHLNTMMKHRNITVERLEKYIQDGMFKDVNLRSFLWKKKNADAVSVTAFKVPNLKRIPFKEAISQTYEPVKVGDRFGPSWATVWFKLVIIIPNDFCGEEVHLIFDNDCEALIWTVDGHPLQGLTGRPGNETNIFFKLTPKAEAGQKIELYIEGACNDLFGAGPGNGIEAPLVDRYFPLRAVEIGVKNMLAWNLLWDYEILLGMVKDLPSDSQHSSDALYTANMVVNTIRREDESSLIEAYKLTREFFNMRSKEGYKSHQITAIGNCHIDTAWLWPYDETKRKIARSFSTQMEYMDQYPNYKFTASQAQQFEWLQNLYPTVFKRVQEKTKAGQFIPIGGTWVEMDCNIPSGESFCRQFLYGQRYFEKAFGERCKVFWLPDTFGYSAQLPQIVKESDMEYFFTQKLSWNNINKFPHTTFMWTGLDGSSVLTHFCPADTYVGQGNVHDINKSVTNNKDKTYSNKSLYLYGNGDGGGGPLVPMIERLQRMANLDCLPAQINFGSPNEFFEGLSKTSKDLNVWKGELYFELHRGTYTSQHLTKRYNRKSEFLLRNIEFLASLSVVKSHDAAQTFKHPKEELDRLWKLVLLNQFHDVLPGSSIEMVYTDSTAFYEDVMASGETLMNTALNYLYKTNSSPKCYIALNSTSWALHSSILELPLNETSKPPQQVTSTGKQLVYVENIPAMGTSCINLETTETPDAHVSVIKSQNLFLVENSLIKVSIDHHGRLVSLILKESNRESIADGDCGNVFKLFEDIPLFWDAWDVEIYHLEKGWNAQVGVATIQEQGPLRVSIVVKHPITKTSSIEQTIYVNAGDPKVYFDTKIHWNENRMMLKVEFPLNVNCDFATYETQFGYIQRPTHANNSWDMARFEVCGHKYADLSEYGFGVALLNDCKYGYSVKENIMRLSLLRAPKAPDAHCDIGTHELKYAIYPHRGTFAESDVVQAGYQFNNPPMLIHNADGNLSSKQYFHISDSNFVLDTVKIAEDPRSGSKGDIVLRFYEAYGGRGIAKVKSDVFSFKKASRCNILEDIGDSLAIDKDGTLTIPYTPFKVCSVRILVD